MRWNFSISHAFCDFREVFVPLGGVKGDAQGCEREEGRGLHTSLQFYLCFIIRKNPSTTNAFLPRPYPPYPLYYWKLLIHSWNRDVFLYGGMGARR